MSAISYTISNVLTSVLLLAFGDAVFAKGRIPHHTRQAEMFQRMAARIPGA
jgi:hypothetical protein